MRYLTPWVCLAFLGACMAVRSPTGTVPELSGSPPVAGVAKGLEPEVCLDKVGIRRETMMPGAQVADASVYRQSERDRMGCARGIARWIVRRAEDLSRRPVRVWVAALGAGEPTAPRSEVVDWFGPEQLTPVRIR